MAAALCALNWAAAQTSNPAHNPHDSPTQEPLFQVQSNLVLVPVFVYTADGLGRLLKPEEWRCVRDEESAFPALSADQPYLPRYCFESEVRDLTSDDFRLLQDGEPQKIKNIEKEIWPLDIRDNWTWHSEISYTPVGAWSTADIGDVLYTGSLTFYLLAYTPALSKGGCHRLRVEVRRPKVQVFARDEYCAEQTPSDLLNGSKTGKKLERELGEKGRGKIPLFVQAGAFRSVAGRRLVDVVLEFPWNQLDRQWDQQIGRFYASISVLGAVYSKDGKLVTRFSDLLWPSYWPVIIRGWQVGHANVVEGYDGGWTLRSLSRFDRTLLPSRYETQFELAPGEYDLRVVLSDGAKAGRAEVPLSIEKDDSSSLALGSVLLCKRFRDAHVAAVETAAANFAPQYVPLVSKGVRVTPAGDTGFAPDEHLLAYFEIYDPQLVHEPPSRIQAKLRIVDGKNGGLVKEFPTVDAATYEQAGSTVIPIVREIPITTLPNGEYRLEVQALDAAGRKTAWRAANFRITEKKFAHRD
jgi:hypothetical protein